MEHGQIFGGEFGGRIINITEQPQQLEEKIVTVIDKRGEAVKIKESEIPEYKRKRLNPRKGETVLDESSSGEERRIEKGYGTNKELWNRDKKTWEKNSRGSRPNKKIDGKRENGKEINKGDTEQKETLEKAIEISEEAFETPKQAIEISEKAVGGSTKMNVVKPESKAFKNESQHPRFDQLRQDIDNGVINVFEESIFPVPSFNQEVTSVTMISPNNINIGEVFNTYSKDFAILVTPGNGKNERFISLVLNRNSKIQDKPELMRLLSDEIIKMDQTVKDPEKKWQAKEDKVLVSGFTTLPVKYFLETLASCFKNIKPKRDLGVAGNENDKKSAATV